MKGKILLSAVMLTVGHAFTLNRGAIPFVRRTLVQPTAFPSPVLLLAMSSNEAPEDNMEVSGGGDGENMVDMNEMEETDSNEESSGEEEVPQEDPEVTAMKEQIAKLEIDVRSARRRAADKSDQADEFTKTGYARKVAEMENMRRARSSLQSSNKFTATASVLSEFIPVMDELYALSSAYGDDDFGKQYSALPGAIRAGFSSMGVTEYEVDVGSIADAGRVSIVGAEESDEPKDTVLGLVGMGMELHGNVIRPANVIVSMGPEESMMEEELSVDDFGGEVDESLSNEDNGDSSDGGSSDSGAD